MPKRIEDYLFAPCGMNCMVCYVHLKDKNPCNGCLGDDNHKPERCKSCKIKICAQEKGLIYCYECSGFPCKQIKNLEKSYVKRYKTSLIENSRIVQKVGITAFQADEYEKWKCISCSGVISLHDSECSDCKKNMHSC